MTEITTAQSGVSPSAVPEEQIAEALQTKETAQNELLQQFLLNKAATNGTDSPLHTYKNNYEKILDTSI